MDPEHRRRGLGTALVQTAEEALRAMGCPKVDLQIRMRNSGVVEFYRALGYGEEHLIDMGKVL